MVPAGRWRGVTGASVPLVEALQPDPRQALVSYLREQMCRHVDGLAIGTTMAALHEHGALLAIAQADRLSFGQLCGSLRANPGFFHVAVRLLADQGWLQLTGEAGTADFAIAPTERGRVVLRDLAEGYARAVAFLPTARQFAHVLSLEPGGDADAAAGELVRVRQLMRRAWDLPSAAPGARAQVLAHLDGHVLGPLISALLAGGSTASGHHPRLGQPGSAALPPARRLAIEILADRGLVRPPASHAALTEAGAIMTTLGVQYWHPVSYLPTLLDVPRLLFGDLSAAPAVGEADQEQHLDRALDIRFSGDVFSSTCRAPFLELALPIFDRRPLEDQPTFVVDTGCGDGRLLETLYIEIRLGTERGRHLADFPLIMVGAEPSPVARGVAAARLANAQVPHLMVDADISEPGTLGNALAAHGLDAREALHVSKSVIHDRAYREPACQHAGAWPPPPSSGAFATPDGQLIPPTMMAWNLADVLSSWRSLARKHGLLVIEAHAADSSVAASNIGRTFATDLDATHGYSCQYPVQPEVFSWAAASAGFRSRAHRALGEAALGHTLLTIDHFVL